MDMQAPDLFASAPNLQLRRTVAIGSEALEEGGVRRSNDTIVCRGRHKGRILAARSWRRERHEAGTGDPWVRVLRGKLLIPKVFKQPFRLSAICVLGTFQLLFFPSS